jgi:hypothetical protein
VRITRAINKLLGRKGRFWADRYHRHDLGTPREVRSAIRYVLLNLFKHLRWPRVEPRTWLLRVAWRSHGLIDPADAPARSA